MAEGFLTPVSLLATIVKTAPDALLVVDGDGQVLFGNEQAESLFKVPLEELLGEPIGGLFTETVATVEQAPEDRVHMIQARDGGETPVEIRSSSVPFEGGVLVAYSLRDVTMRERAAREALQLREELAHVGRVSALGELVSAVAHEINQPLAAILSNAQAAQRFLGGESPDLEEVGSALEDIVSEDRRASAVITHLRSMMRRELRDATDLEVGGLIADLDPLVGADATEREIELVFDVPQDMPAVHGDRIQLQQVLLNLILNALDAIDSREGAPRRVEVRGWVDENGVQLAVSDEGVGLREGEEDTVFESFVTSKKHGLGMGLSICRTVIEAHEGRIWAERNPRAGATFRITLPPSSAS